MNDPIEYERLGAVELPREVDRLVTRMTKQSDRDVEEARVTFRWGKSQVELVKRAARLAGVPYQTYMKIILYRQVVADLSAAERLSGVSAQTDVGAEDHPGERLSLLGEPQPPRPVERQESTPVEQLV